MANSYVTTVQLEHNWNWTDPLTATRNSNKFWRFNELRKLIKAMLTGTIKPGGVARVGSAQASGTLTLTSTGGAVNDTCSINGVAFTAKQHSATGTVTFASVAAADTVTIGAVTYTMRVSPTLAHEVALGASDTAAAANLVIAVNADAVSSLVVFASSAAGVVTFRALSTGTAGNSIVLLSSNGSRAAVTGSGTLTGATAPAANEWDQSGTITQQAASFAACVNASVTALVSSYVTATSAAGVATITAIHQGLSGNGFTLAKSGSNLAVSGSGRLTGGATTVYNF